MSNEEPKPFMSLIDIEAIVAAIQIVLLVVKMGDMVEMSWAMTFLPAIAFAAIVTGMALLNLLRYLLAHDCPACGRTCYCEPGEIGSCAHCDRVSGEREAVSQNNAPASDGRGNKLAALPEERAADSWWP
jgi:hypothetical protein